MRECHLWLFGRDPSASSAGVSAFHPLAWTLHLSGAAKTKLHLQKGCDFVLFDRRIMSGRSEVTVTSLGKTSFLFICIHLQDRSSSLHQVFRFFGFGKRSATERRREASLPWSAPQRGFQTGIFLSCFSAPQDPLCFCRWRYLTRCLMKN